MKHIYFYINFQLATGFKSNRTENSILIWDIRSNSTNPTLKMEQSSQYSISNLASLTNNINTGIGSHLISTLNSSANFNIADLKRNFVFEPVYETGISETCNSLSWNPHDENLLLTGMTGKSLRIYDIRSII